MSLKQRIINLFSGLVGSKLDSLIITFLNYRIAPRYYYRAFFIFLGSFFMTPFRWYEILKYKKAIRKTEFNKPPIFIVGHWRSGTTFLHNLISQDPQLGFVDTYQAFFPEIMGSRKVLKSVVKFMLPEKRPSDNINISTKFPQEEEFAVGNLHPYSYYHFWYFPKDAPKLFDKYIAFEGVSDRVKRVWKKAYVRLVKKAMINTESDRVVLKNPVNTGRIPMLLEMFPDAKFIFIYRNPYLTFKSTRKLLTKTFPMTQLHPISDEELDKNMLYIYNKLLDKYEADKHLVPAGNLIEIKYEEFELDPEGEMKRIYESLGIGGYAGAEPHFSAYLDQLKGYQKNKYQFSEEEIRLVTEHWKDSLDRWGYPILTADEPVGQKAS